MRLVAFDTETTGTDPVKDRIVELYMQEVSWPMVFQTGEPLAFIANPMIPIPPAATMVHGISDERVADQPPFAAMADAVQEFVKDAILIAYNGRRFDVPLLHYELVRNGCKGLPVDQAVIDPYELFIQDAPRTLTGAVRHYLERDHQHAHDAEEDVNAMLNVLRFQIHRREPTKVLDEARHPKRLPLDHGGRFFRDPDGVVRFGFGMHRGKPVNDFPDYLEWMLDADFEPEAKEVAKRCLHRNVAA